MPRKPTAHARWVESALRRQIATARAVKGVPLPAVRSLAGQMDISYSTISRIFSRLVQESVVWQHPNGRFYPAAAREQISKVLPIVILGRQVQHWSVLYREILEGVSEVCAARGCPLVFLSSDKLVRHESPDRPPIFATEEVQEKELARLLSSLPKPCGGILFDHLWSDRLIAATRRSYPSSAMLVRGSLDGTAGSVPVNTQVAAELMLNYVANCGYAEILIGVPFAGDQAINASQQALETVLARGKPAFQAVSTVDCSTPRSRKRLLATLRNAERRTALVSLEDNVTSLLWRGFQLAGIDCPGTIGLASIQGTAALGAPVTRLRYNYRRLGREAVASLLSEGIPTRPFRPVLIRGRTVAPVA
jgi:DNA-binding LacI/PurR family transcriptional regulator